jgi:hypothetical protein
MATAGGNLAKIRRAGVVRRGAASRVGRSGGESIWLGKRGRELTRWSPPRWWRSSRGAPPAVGRRGGGGHRLTGWGGAGRRGGPCDGSSGPENGRGRRPMVKSSLRRWRTAVACFGQYVVAVDSLGQRSTRGSRSCAASWRSSAAFLG